MSRGFNHITILALTIMVNLFASSIQAQVIDTRKYLNPDLEDGQCHSIADSKVYLSSIPAEKFNELKAQLSAERMSQIKNTETTSWYFCKLSCVLNQSKTNIWVALTDKNENFKVMTGFVCPYLTITDVEASSTLTFKTVVAQSFWAADSNLVDLRSYLTKTNYTLSPEVYQKFIKTFKNKALEVNKYFYMSQNQEMINAGKTLQQWIGSEAPEKIPELQSRVEYLRSINWEKKIEIKDYLKQENLIDTFLIQNGKFLEYLQL